ncbi:MAG: hypothetical protein M1118_11025 [Chloroflexi bacterium]|nr:hypothetical protein [Chloroflexota bacterium]
MAVVSQLELPGSPSEQASYAVITYYWNPAQTGDLASGETVTNPGAKVLQYDPRYPWDTVDVTATTLAAGSPFVGTGAYAAEVGVTVQDLVPGYEYRVELWFTASGGHTPGRFFRVRCLV